MLEGVRLLTGVLAEPAFALRSLRALRGIDLLVVVGSGPIYDGWDGPWVHPYNLFKWTWLARITRTPVHMLCVGAGPISAPLSRFFLRHALRNAEHVTFRDESSARLVEALGLLAGGAVLPDQGFALRLPRRLPGPRLAAPRRRLVVGVNPMAHEDPRYLPHGRRRAFAAYLDRLGGFVGWLLAERYEVRLFSSARPDLRVCRELERRLVDQGLLAPGESLVRRDIGAVDDLIEEVASCDFVVAARFHCILLPALLGIPVIGMAYHPKTRNLLDGLGQARFTLDIDGFTTPEIVALFCELRAAGDDVRQVFASRVPELRKALGEQYDLLYGPVVTP